MTNKEYCEMIHQRDTGGKIIYDLHYSFCVLQEHNQN